MFSNFKNKYFLILILFLLFTFIISSFSFASDTYSFSFLYNDNYCTLLLPEDTSVFEYRLVVALQYDSEYRHFVFCSHSPIYHDNNYSITSDTDLIYYMHSSYVEDITYFPDFLPFGSTISSDSYFGHKGNPIIFMFSTHDIYTPSGDLVFQVPPLKVDQVEIPTIQSVEEIPQVMEQVMKILIPIGLIVFLIGLVIYLTHWVILRLQ